ncbi:MAG: RidA family protein [Gemmatimonadetes bacterium]|nr:RidA family protein [Gemmatimonadota bacterium]
MHKILQPDGWAPPRGYSNGMSAAGRFVFVSGQVGWNSQSKFESDDLVDQIQRALENVVAVLAADGARAEHIASLTWYFTDKAEYVARSKEVGEAYRAVIGRHYPTMTAVEVSSMIEPRAKVEIQAIAVVPE